MTVEEKALEIVLHIYGAMDGWDNDYSPKADDRLITLIDNLVTPFVEKEFPFIYDRVYPNSPVRLIMERSKDSW